MLFFKKEVKPNPVDFLVLFSGFAVAAGVFFSFPYRLSIQKLVVVVTGIYYFLWGLWHHHKRGDLCVKIGIEYFLFAVLGTSVILSTLLRG